MERQSVETAGVCGACPDCSVFVLPVFRFDNKSVYDNEGEHGASGGILSKGLKLGILSEGVKPGIPSVFKEYAVCNSVQYHRRAAHGDHVGLCIYKAEV